MDNIITDCYESLPLTIRAQDSLLAQSNKLAGALNKLEAQFNFQTLGAAWYADEANIVEIECRLYPQLDFFALKEEQAKTPDYYKVADDVFYHYYPEQQQIYCSIAITYNEDDLLVKQPKILAPLLQKKLRVVLNVIAEHLNYQKLK